MTRYDLTINPFWVMWPVIVQGLGLGMIFVPLSTIAFSTLAPRYSAEGAGIYSLLRTIGSSIGISITTTVLYREGQVAWNQLGGYINPYNPQVGSFVSSFGGHLSDPTSAAVLAMALGRQTQMRALIDDFSMITWSFVVLLPLIALLKRQPSDALKRDVKPVAE